MRLTQNFTSDEFEFSSTALRLGIDNTPQSSFVIQNLLTLAVGLEKVRKLLNDNPILIDSGYRCDALNKAVGGATNSAHIYGYAADFRCPQFGTPLDIVKVISESDIVFDQCIMEGRWVHISFDPQARRQILIANFSKDGTTYTHGVNYV